MVETLREQVEKRAKSLAVPRTDTGDMFDYGAVDVSSEVVKQAFPWVKMLVGDKFLPREHLARVVIHSAEDRERVVHKGSWPFQSKDRQAVPGYQEIRLILPSREGRISSAFELSWRLTKGEEGKFFLGSAELPVTDDQLQGLDTLLLPDHVREIQDNRFPSPAGSN